jgi:hypothetical protein
MSAGSDNIFSRWSRRKQAVRNGEARPPHEQEHVADGVAPEATAVPVEPVDQQLAAVELEDPEDIDPAEPLPRLEDLTAESDLSAFLRKGVPKALKKAAMRKMWSLDPAIRDYIGPSEYAWDFNTPGSMAGFGPLDANDPVIADFLSTMSGGVRAGLAKAIAAPEASPEQEADPVLPDEEASASPDSPHDGPVEAASSEESPELPPMSANPQSHSRDHRAAAAEPLEPANPAESSRIPAPSRHGRAMPR